MVFRVVLPISLFCFLAWPAYSQELNRRELAREQYPDLSLELANPLSRILLLQSRFRYQEGIGPEGTGSLFAAALAPRIPFVLGEMGHLISKTDIAWVSRLQPGLQRG